PADRQRPAGRGDVDALAFERRIELSDRERPLSLVERRLELPLAAIEALALGPPLIRWELGESGEILRQPALLAEQLGAKLSELLDGLGRCDLFHVAPNKQIALSVLGAEEGLRGTTRISADASPRLFVPRYREDPVPATSFAGAAQERTSGVSTADLSALVRSLCASGPSLLLSVFAFRTSRSCSSICPNESARRTRGRPWGRGRPCPRGSCGRGPRPRASRRA